MIPAEKACSDCSEVKSLDAFYRDKSRPDGRTYRCKACITAYRAANKDRIRRINVTYWAKNADKVREWNRAKHLANREARLAQHRAYYQVNAERIKAQNREWQIANPERRREIVLMASHRRRARMREATTFDVSAKDLRRLLNGSCAVPGCTDRRIEIDHVIPISRGGLHGIGNLQPLCKSHNSAKCGRLWIEFRVYLRTRSAA